MCSCICFVFAERSASPRTPVRQHTMHTTAAAALSGSNSDVFVTCSPLRSPSSRSATETSTATTTPETFPFGPESPVLMSMSQRAIQLGIEVTWASSPKRRSSSPLIDRTAVDSGSASPNATDLLRRRSIKHRQIFKPHRNAVHSHHQQSHQHRLANCSKKGIHKFNEELMKLAPKRTNSLTDLTPDSAANSDGMSRAHSVESAGSASTTEPTAAHQLKRSPISISFGTPVRMSGVSTPPLPLSKRTGPVAGTSAAAAVADHPFGDYMSTSMQNEFLDNSDLDMELFRSSQDAEQLFNEQANQPPVVAKPAPAAAARQIFGDVALLENDSIDEYLTSKELDAYIMQSQSETRAPSPKRPLERHKSMPLAQQSMLSGSDQDLMTMMDETDFEGHLSAFGLASKTSPSGSNAKGNRGTSSAVMGRHNSMPMVSLGRAPQRRPMRAYVPPPMEKSINIHSDSFQSDDD